MRSQPIRIFGSRFAMALLAALAFQPSLLSAQGGDVQSEASNADKLSAAVLKASELAKLNRLLRSWYLYEIKALSILNRSEAFGRKPGKKNRQKIANYRKKASWRREVFFDEFQKQSKRVGALLRYFAALATITNNCFAVSKKAHARNTRLESVFPKRKKAIEKRSFARHLPNPDYSRVEEFGISQFV